MRPSDSNWRGVLLGAGLLAVAAIATPFAIDAVADLQLGTTSDAPATPPDELATTGDGATAGTILGLDGKTYPAP